MVGVSPFFIFAPLAIDSSNSYLIPANKYTQRCT